MTGGGSGLGRVMVDMLLLKGAKVAVLDVRQMDGEAREWKDRGRELWWEGGVDVGSEERVRWARDRIVDVVSPFFSSCLCFWDVGGVWCG